jgi:hypothetical protein
MRVVFATSFLAALVAACSGEAGPARVEVRDAVVTLPAVPGRPGAAYFSLRSSVAARLTGVDSARAGRIELHDPGMRRAEAVALSPGETVRFEPGGRHAMLFELDPSLKAGDRLSLTFSFADGPPVTAEAEVRLPGDAQPRH